MRCVLFGLILFVAACSPEYEHNEAALFDSDWRSQYTKVVSCKESPTHNGNRIETWANASALEAYQDRTKDFPLDAVVLKAQYDNDSCSGQEAAWTVMKKVTEGPVMNLEDWRWQRVEIDGSIGYNPTSPGFCGDCHMGCDQGGFMCDLPE